MDTLNSFVAIALFCHFLRWGLLGPSCGPVLPGCGISSVSQQTVWWSFISNKWCIVHRVCFLTLGMQPGHDGGGWRVRVLSRRSRYSDSVCVWEREGDSDKDKGVSEWMSKQQQTLSFFLSFCPSNSFHLGKKKDHSFLHQKPRSTNGFPSSGDSKKTKRPWLHQDYISSNASNAPWRMCFSSYSIRSQLGHLTLSRGLMLLSEKKEMVPSIK